MQNNTCRTSQYTREKLELIFAEDHTAGLITLYPKVMVLIATKFNVLFFKVVRHIDLGNIARKNHVSFRKLNIKLQI